jgi:tetratricopeptide (TPR) repeat protein
VTWGGERILAALAALRILPDQPMARWLLATVYVARELFADAEREVDAALAAMNYDAGAQVRYAAVGLYLLKGLLLLARGAEEEGIAALRREIALEATGHIYARLCAAHAFYAIGAWRLRKGDAASAREAFAQALRRVPNHPMACVGLMLLEGVGQAGEPRNSRAGQAPPLQAAMAQAAALAMGGDDEGGARVVLAALASSPAAGSEVWMLPLDPLLGVQPSRAAWAGVLSVLKNRAE